MIHDMRSLRGHYLDRWVRSREVRQAAVRLAEPPVFDQVAPLAPLPARVYQGLWIVDCPCGGAEMVCKGHPIVWCCSCGNRYCGGLWRRVELPPEVSAIEALLDVRPFPVNQNWHPGETLAQLAAENAEHGL